jgi:gag-polyprotein putative aspartyl protease
MEQRKTWMRFWLFVLVLLTVCAPAQETIKVSVANNVVLVPVRVNGRSLFFELDTGSERSAIDAALVTRLGLKSVGDVQILRNYRIQETSAAEAGSLGIGKHVFEHTGIRPLRSDPVALEP